MKKEILNKAEIAENLNVLLSNYQMYYQNLRALHWNIKGKMFFMLHEKFEEFYNEASTVIDEIAERILMLKETPLHTYADYISNSTIGEVKNVSDANQSIKIVLENNNILLNDAYKVNEIASEAGDEGTIALISEIISALEKRIWMLESSME